jgi:hypothetical protein
MEVVGVVVGDGDATDLSDSVEVSDGRSDLLVCGHLL